MARKPFLLRIDATLLEVLQRWANDDLRSLNGQLEFLLRRAAQDAGRVRAPSGGAGADEEPGLPPTGSEQFP